MAKTLRIQDSVIFTGPLYGEEKLAAYADSDVCVLPSLHEAFPMSLLEACACGKPIIATRIQTLKDFVSKAGGLLFEPQNDEELAVQLQRVLNNRDAVSLGRRGKSFVEANFTIERVADQFEDLYGKVVRN